MSKHTPGPWSFDGPSNNIHVREADRPHMRICFMTSDGPARANARLIAAAPDLLAALKEIVHPDNQAIVWFVPTVAYAIKLREAAVAAIAKAEGAALKASGGPG